MSNIIYKLQYVNLKDGRTIYHYRDFTDMDALKSFVDVHYHGDWSSYEVIVTTF